MSHWARRQKNRRIEQEADELAARAMQEDASPSKERETARRRRAAAAPGGEWHTPGGGMPLDEATRAEMERRFDFDFSQVRVHERDPAARRMGSRAYATGSHIAFAEGEYAPATQGGRQLLAHELAHVVQAQRGQPVGLASKTAPPPRSFYQEVIDQYNSSWGKHELAIKPVLEFCQAVEAERSNDIGKLLDALDKTDVYILPPDFPLSSTTAELLTRLMLMGLPREASRFRTWYVALPGVKTLGQQTARRYYDDEIWFWREVYIRLLERVDWADGNASLRVLDAMSGFFTQVERERNGLDKKAIEADVKRLKQSEQSTLSAGFGMESSPNVSIARYYHQLGSLMKDLFVAMQTPFQAALERAAEDLAAKKGSQSLDNVEKRLTSIFDKLALPADLSVAEINNWVWVTDKSKKETLRQIDFFLDEAKARKRSVKLESYDVTTEGLYVGPSKELDYRRIITIRRAQVNALKRIFGLEKDAQGKQTPDAKENEAAQAAVGGDGLQLHNDEDWRKFLKAKYEAHLATSKSAEESLDAVIDLIKTYMQAFTTHSPLNIDDFGDDLLRVQFPRALTGQLVHDCGVYALRITYLLSLMRDLPSLKLQLRYVQLPVHIGLIITSSIADLPAYLVHNDTFSKYPATDIAILRKKWDSIDAQGNPRVSPAAHTKANDDQFYGELAADAFVPLTDMPMIVSDVPALGGKSEKADKDVLWRNYRKLVQSKLFGKASEDPKSPHYQFHLRYLKLLEMIKAHHNKFLVPFWDDLAHPAWGRARPGLEQANTALTAATTPKAKTAAEKDFDAKVKVYLKDKPRGLNLSVEQAFDKVQAAYGSITLESANITTDLQRSKDVLVPGVSKAASDRMLEMFDQFAEPAWARDVRSHISDMSQRILSPPPYAEKKDLLPVID
jgi:hypothetical protein